MAVGRAPAFSADPEATSVDSVSLWDGGRGIMALHKYYALRDEAEDRGTENQRVWLDTPFSVFAIQCKYFLLVYCTVLNAALSI
jgi:serine/arginine repetitive matrix protein 2